METTLLFFAGAIIAAVQGVKKATIDPMTGETYLPGWVIIILAGLVGMLGGLAGTYYGYPRFEGIDPITGLLTGLAAAGGLTILKETASSFGKALRGTNRVAVRELDLTAKAVKQGDPIAKYAQNTETGMEYQGGEFGVYDPEHHGKG